MKVLIFWDIYWRIWREWLKKEIWGLKNKFKPDFVLANVDNLSSWRWPIEKHILELEKAWVDLMLWWDHVLDNISKIAEYLDDKNWKLIRPANFIEQEYYYIPWKWYKVIEKDWKRLLVIHILWNVFMSHVSVDNPFLKVESILKDIDPTSYDSIIIDYHKETTAEWYGLAHFLENNPCFIYGTHTHIQTNDEYIFDSGVWIISDVGMSGPLNSVIWANFDSVKKRFLTWIQKWKIEQSLDPKYVVNAISVEFDEYWNCKNLEKIRIRWKLS